MEVVLVIAATQYLPGDVESPLCSVFMLCK